MDYADWAAVFDVNTLGPMRVIDAFLDNVTCSELKLVVALTSAMGSLADNKSGGRIAYRSSKAAVHMVTRSLAVDLEPRGITCVVVSPGWVSTDMGGPNAPLTPAASVEAMRKLIGTLGPSQTGKFFNYDGSEYAW
jgi:NAD(P)-dependent dehydrogenase (short-subunit alcohol dehydrogenase family)